MKNITLALEEKLIKSGRAYASRHNTSLNNIIRESLKQRVENDSTHWIDDCLSLIDTYSRPRKARKWRREDLYER